MKDLFKYLGGDRNIWVLAIFLGLISVVSVFSFIPILVKVKGMSYAYLFFKHFSLLLLGFVLMYVVHKIPVKVYSRLARFLMYVAVILLVLTMLVGESVNGADRWLKIPFVPFSFQTSDFAKLALIVYLARQFTKRKDEFGDFKVVFKHILLPTGMIILLILPSNLSTAGLVAMLAFAMMILAKFPWKWIGLSVGSMVAVFLLLLLVAKLQPEVLPRVETWRMRIVRMFGDDVEQKEQIQVNNALAAIKNGAITWNDPLPEGPGNGVLKHYIPEAYADFYFAALIEEGGLPTAILIIILYLAMFFRFIKAGLGAEDLYGTYVALGIAVMLMSQALINMMVSTKLMPVTGQNMPLLSMGGTSSWFTCIAFGMVLSISRNQFKSTNQTEPNVIE
ncbi:MAG: FtsW/RodA/SpoVE family cell cycle protein [Crocinitomicaceae bacterium]|nr:FtsW/RodA/SpoVE family cell cycle protein [Crocinitomicaceae bacterium]MBK8926965.1 FtsW/RodA/SpoVE family cell cycle protein [Crocinitomicaceae bacterium]